MMKRLYRMTIPFLPEASFHRYSGNHAFIEEAFDIKVEDDEMLPEHLDSINNLVAFIQRKQTIAA